jgi:hypothetical protein
VHEFVQIIFGIGFMVVAFILTRIWIARKIRHAATLIIQDLEKLEAFDSSSAAELPYASPHYIRIGLRDYRPKALVSLIQAGVVNTTESGRYYLMRRINVGGWAKGVRL